jgi:hypothetical protein
MKTPTTKQHHPFFIRIINKFATTLAGMFISSSKNEFKRLKDYITS